MRVVSAKLSGFRNIQLAEFSRFASVTALFGENGQGKTNALEAFYLAAALRPLRSVQRQALLWNTAEKARIDLRVFHQKTQLSHDLRIELSAKSRTLFKDDKRVEAKPFLGALVAVAFTPDDLQLAKGSPEGRRRFLDRALLNQQPSYLDLALSYSRALKDRNRLLVDGCDDALLAPYEALLADYGARITEAREAYVKRLFPKLEGFFSAIARPAPKLELRYQSRLKPFEASLKAQFLDRLKALRGHDRRRKSTSLGPHLDDLELRLDGVLAKDRASQGQHRALVLALKLAEITDLADQLGEAPVLLLDDMSSELDPKRSRQLFETIQSLDAQLIMTSTDAKILDLAGLAKRSFQAYEVDSGRFRPLDESLGVEEAGA